MGDPELRSDESVLLRTQGIHVKSVPFEGILTNKRIILVDRTTNILPQKEIPLVTVKDFQAGENAIRDQIITLSVLARTGETRKIILTFSRQTGGNRIKERDEWLRVLKVHTSLSLEQVVRKVIPNVGQSPKKPTRTAPPRLEIISSPVSQKGPSAEKTAMQNEAEDTAPVKKIIKTSQGPSLSSSEVKKSEDSSLGFGTYCSRCGNRVPDGSRFCNRCGSKIVVPDNMSASATPKAEVPPLSEQSTRTVQPIEKENPVIEHLIEPSPASTSLSSVPSDPLWSVPQQPEIIREQKSAITFTESVYSPSDSNFPVTYEKQEQGQPVIIDSKYSGAISPSGKPSDPQKPWDGFSFKPGKKTVLSVIVVIIIVAIVLGAFFLYPMISTGEGTSTANRTTFTTIPTIIKNSGSAVMSSKTLQPETGSTYRSIPGNSGSSVGL